MTGGHRRPWPVGAGIRPARVAQRVFATYTITEPRAQKVAFAGPYYSSGTSVGVRADETAITGVGDLNGKNVVTLDRGQAEAAATLGTNLLVQTYLIVAAIYVVLNLLLPRFAVWLERRLGSRTSGRAARGKAAEPEGVPQTMA